MSAYDARDPWWVPAPLTAQTSARPRRAAVTIDPMGNGVDPDIAAGIQKAAQVLSAAGYEVTYADPPDVAAATDLWGYLVQAEMRTLTASVIRPLVSADARRALDLFASVVREPDLAGYMNALAERNLHARNWSQFFTQYDVLIGPVSTMQPFEVGFDIADGASALQVGEALGLTVTCNLVGLPAVVVPVGVAHGLPQAVQIIGARFQEMSCLDAAEMIETSLGTVTPIDPIANT